MALSEQHLGELTLRHSPYVAEAEGCSRLLISHAELAESRLDV